MVDDEVMDVAANLADSLAILRFDRSAEDVASLIAQAERYLRQFLHVQDPAILSNIPLVLRRVNQFCDSPRVGQGVAPVIDFVTRLLKQYTPVF